ncbi:MAG TPA: MBL fold metallo-hydrolase [Acidimicrobiales bacterium]|nr:MBL fold metallo-hydrolase [Acidimicrobiales bacterium]
MSVSDQQGVNVAEAIGLNDLAEAAWRGELDLVHEHHPVHRGYQGSEEILPGVLASKGLAGIYVIDTGDGLVLLDGGTILDSDAVFEAVRSWRPDLPLRAVVFSHHHIDHIYSTGPFEAEAAERGWAPPTVYGHELMPDHFDRYRRTLGWNTAINKRQFAIHAPNFRWPSEYRYPDVTFGDGLSLRVGDLSFEMHHARGETDDHVWTWIPQRRILHTGDLFIYAVPNAGNPQKVQRYVSDWAAALREMAALEPDVLLPGHGLPIHGRDRIVTALSDTAALLESIESQTLALMNRGLTLDQVIHSVEIPGELLAKPYLQPVYDHPQFLVRMVWRRYGGWWDGEPDNLLPAPRDQQAIEWVNLAGGVEAVLERTRELVASGDLRMACHLVEAATMAAPDDEDVHRLRSEVYGARSQEQMSSMARNILNHAALASQEGLRDLAASPAYT